MDTTTLLIILIVVLILVGGGWYGRRRWYVDALQTLPINARILEFVPQGSMR
jgi:LPXTG-motif cell wall-anchored protein